MEDFRNKLVQELEEFNKNADMKLKEAGELHLERESEDDLRIDLERDLRGDGRDLFSQSYTDFGDNKTKGTLMPEPETGVPDKGRLEDPHIADYGDEVLKWKDEADEIRPGR